VEDSFYNDLNASGQQLLGGFGKGSDNPGLLSPDTNAGFNSVNMKQIANAPTVRGSTNFNSKNSTFAPIMSSLTAN
jgi:hypothetical protein